MKVNLFKTIALIAFLTLSACGSSEKKKEAEETATPVATESKTNKLKIEKPQLTFGFIKLTDMAPLAIAKEKGFFEDEGLFVSVEAQSNWKNILDRVIDGQLDGSHMLAGQPIAQAQALGDKQNWLQPFQWI